MEADDQEVKTIVQELLTTKSLATLSAAGCPLSKGMMSLIGQDKYACTISYDKRERFVHWLRRQDFEQGMLVSHVKATASPLQSMIPIKIAKSRVTFDPEGEITKLEDWFDRNQRPNMETIMEYTETLNKGRLGKSKRMLLPDSIAVWFKNRRARAKKEESASNEQILSISSQKLWDVVQQDYEMPTMVPLSKRRKSSLGKGDDQESNIVHSVPSCATTIETNIKQKNEEPTANVTQPAKNTSTDSHTILPCGEETVRHWIMLENQDNNREVPVDQEMVDSQRTTDNQGGNILENGDKNIGNQQITKGNQSSDNMETDNESGIQVVENANKKNDDHTTIVTDSTGKLGSETNGKSEDVHAVCYVKSEESKTENQLIQGVQDSGVSSLKRVREEMDEEVLDHHHIQLCSLGPGHEQKEKEGNSLSCC